MKTSRNLVRTLNKVGTAETYLNIIKAIDDKLSANITHNGQKVKVFFLRSGTRQECLLLPLFFNIVLKVLPTAIRV